MSPATPDPDTTYDVIVVGGGIAGSAAALRAAQYMHRTLWIQGDKLDAKRSRMQWVYNLDNMIGFHDGIVRKKVQKLLRKGGHEEAREALMAAPHLPISTRDVVDNVVDRLEEGYAGHVAMLPEHASEARREEDGSFVVQAGDASFRATHLVLATGVMDRQPQILHTKKGKLRDDIKWIYPAANREQVLYCIRCEGHLTRGQRCVVIGSGEAAAQLAMMLHERYRSAAGVLTNGEEPAWKDESARLLAAYGIPVHRARITDLHSEKDGLHGIDLDDGTQLDVAFGLVSMGLYAVYNQLARQLGATLGDDESKPVDERHVLIDARGETDVPNLFVVGDMAQRPDEPVMKQVYTCQEYAVRALDVVDARMRRARRQAVLDGLLEKEK